MYALYLTVLVASLPLSEAAALVAVPATNGRKIQEHEFIEAHFVSLTVYLNQGESPYKQITAM